LLFLSIPFFIYVFQLSLRDAAGFDAAIELLRLFYVRVFCALVLWALLHHLIAGLRYLLTDVHLGLGRASARTGAWGVLIGEVIAACIVLWVWP
jgi:succinate dehydrogenase / fumarate reductase, cytochrome b subunit